MTKVYRFNSWFEWELESLLYSGNLSHLTNHKQNQDAFLEKLFLALSAPEDIVLLRSPPTQSLFDFWKEAKFPISSNILSLEDVEKGGFRFRSEDLLLQEFGALRKLEKGKIIVSESIWRKSAFLNSRIRQKEFSDYSQSYEGEVDAHSRILRAKEDLYETIESLPEDLRENPGSREFFGFLFKSEFSSSGRGHILWRGSRDNYRFQKIKFPVLCENYHKDRALDFGILFDITENGWKLPKSLSAMWIGKDFQFLGSIFRGEINWKDLGKIVGKNLFSKYELLDSLEKRIGEIWEKLSVWNEFSYRDEVGKKHSYLGSAVVDGYFLETGELRLRSEINFRWSLGRIAWEVRQKKIQIQGRNLVAYYGILILHVRAKVPLEYDYLIPLSISESEPWRIVYLEKFLD